MMKFDRKQGQTMLLTVMLITGAILSATTIAALLVLYQLRQASDVKASTKAIYAADAGIECVLYERIVNGAVGVGDYGNCGESGQVNLDNGTFYTVVVDPSDGSVKSAGRSDRAARAFEISF